MKHTISGDEVELGIATSSSTVEHRQQQGAAFGAREGSKELLDAAYGFIFGDDPLVGGGHHGLLQLRPHILNSREIWRTARPHERAPELHITVVVGIIAEVPLGDVRHMWSRIVLLKAVGFPSEQLFDGRHKFILEEFAVARAVDVASNNKGADQSPPSDSSIHVQCGRVAVDAHGFGFLVEQHPLAVVPRVVLEFPGNEGGVGAHESPDPVRRFAVEHIAVRLAECEVPRLERDPSGASSEPGHLCEMAADGGFVDPLLCCDALGAFPLSDDAGDDPPVLRLGDCAPVARVARPPDDGVVGDDVADAATGDGVAARRNLVGDVSVAEAVSVVREHQSPAGDGFRIVTVTSTK